MTTDKPRNIDEYISGFPKEVQKILELIRETIKKAAPGSEETISYGMPTFKLDKLYVAHFAAFKNHIGFYPAPTKNKEFSEDFSRYKTGKGSIQFPLDKPMPVELITRIVEHRMKGILEPTRSKK